MRTRIATALATLAVAGGMAVAVLPAAPASAAPTCYTSTVWGGAFMPAYGSSPRCATQQGNVSDAVAILQNTINQCYGAVLRANGLAPLAVDRSFGPKTKAALTAVQRYLRITPDGGYGPQTGNAMRWLNSNDACVDTPAF